MPGPAEHASTEQLADLLEGVLAAGEAAAVADHLRGCERCSRERDQLAALPALLASTPAEPMPAPVAARLADVLAAESRRRDGAHASPAVHAAVQRPAVHPPVPIGSTAGVSDRHRPAGARRSRQWLAGLAAAAAVVVAVSVVGDVWVQGGGGDGSVADGSGSEQAEGQSSDQGGDARSGAGGRPATARLDRLPTVTSDSFAADVGRLYDAETGNFVASRDPQRAPPGGEVDEEGAGVAPGDCQPSGLRADDVAGTYGPLVRVDRGQVARLVAMGPRRSVTVTAYSCDDGSVVASTRLPPAG